MPDGHGGPKPSFRVLWWLFGVLGSLAATATLLLFWLVRFRPSARSQSPSTPDTAEPGVVNPPVDESANANGDSCDVTCVDSCASSGTGVCDDLANDVCQQPIDDVCGSTTDCGSGLDCGSGVNCNSSIAGSQLAHLLAGGQPWFSSAGPQPRSRVTLPARVGIAVIHAYQRHVSRRLGTHCRFTPSCSAYGVDALRRYGALDGAMLTVTRIRRCTVAIPCGTLDPA